MLAMVMMTILECSFETFLVNGDWLFEIQRPKVEIGLRLVCNKELTVNVTVVASEGHNLKTEEVGRR